ncbi:DEAD/DEAH box helicase family protein [Novacetimonas cocois]|uniref:hypothetical protein n=1 Tax=Novacetimonas cocois TaxID=1747507 RepID=UPI001EF1609F|nr:hypothetical protein [Novacetimonas cocois]
MAKFFKINAPCGAGKTYALPKIIGKIQSNGKKAIIAQPKIDNLKETETALKGLGMNVCRYDSETQASPVAAIIGYLTGSPKPDDILLVTHNGLMEAVTAIDHHSPCLGQCVVIVDEALAIIGSESIKLKTHHRLITDNVRLVDPTGSISECEVINKKPLEKYRDNQQNDDINNVVGPVAKILLDETISVSALVQNFNNPKSEHLEFLWHRKPDIFDGFNGVIMMSADFDQSIVFNVWKQKYKVHFQDFPSKLNFRYTSHANTTNTTIHFFMDRNFSKKLGQADNFNVHNQMVAIIDRIILEQECLTILNNEINTDV